MELAPREELKGLFFRLMEKVDLEGMVYSQLKIIYETDSRRLNTFDLLKNEEKNKVFGEYLRECLDSEEITSEMREKKMKHVGKLLRSKEKAKKLQLSNYF